MQLEIIKQHKKYTTFRPKGLLAALFLILKLNVSDACELSVK